MVVGSTPASRSAATARDRVRLAASAGTMPVMVPIRRTSPAPKKPVPTTAIRIGPAARHRSSSSANRLNAGPPHSGDLHGRDGDDELAAPASDVGKLFDDFVSEV